jgi:Predicted integral membrane protein (DUF2269)
MIADTVMELHVVLAIHIAAIVVTFGVIFARPIVFAVASKQDPRSLPLLHRIEYTIERRLIGPGLLVVILSGIYMTSWLQHWGQFVVQWGLGVVVLSGAALGVVMIPSARRAMMVAERDVQASAEGAIHLSDEYRAIARPMAAVGLLLGLLVLITVLFMGLEYPLSL